MSEEFVKVDRPLKDAKESLNTVYDTLCAQEEQIACLSKQLMDAKGMIERFVGSTDAGEIIRERDELRDKYAILRAKYEVLREANKCLTKRCRGLELATEMMSKQLRAYEEG